MKNIAKNFNYVLIAAILLSVTTPTAKTAKAVCTENNKVYFDTTQVQIIYDDNGGYFVETLEETQSSLNSPSYPIDTNSTTVTKSYTKRTRYYDEKNVLCWTYSLTATFSVKLGSSATYKSSTASLDNANPWSVVSESHSGSGSKATGTIKMKKNGNTVSRTVTIQCDKNGNFS